MQLRHLNNKQELLKMVKSTLGLGIEIVTDFLNFKPDGSNLAAAKGMLLGTSLFTSSAFTSVVTSSGAGTNNGSSGFDKGESENCCVNRGYRRN